MTNTQKTIIIIGIIAVMFSWSIWFFTFFPRNYSGKQIQTRCDEETRKSRYCIGFAEGYNWAFMQMRMNEQLQEINYE